MNIIHKENYNVPVFSWCPEIEDGAMVQIDNLARLPFVFNRVAIMPDCHQGYGMPIGGVLATKGVLIPNAVGVDIGCGMCAVKTTLTELDAETLKNIMSKVREVVPVGFSHQAKSQEGLLSSLDNSLFRGNDADTFHVVSREFQSAMKQLGTLGGGNHFVEFQKGSDGHVWIMIHSGSRNLGKQVAEHYNNIAVALNDKYYSVVDKKQELAFLPMDTAIAGSYMDEMQFCVDFALANRKLMMSRIKEIFVSLTGCGFLDLNNNTTEGVINIAHNYARLESHFGHNVMVHRKGATLASKDTIGIIPGSQGSKSCIVKGLGNVNSFKSCSHGAGRKMGRKEAERTLDLDMEIKRLDDQGILHSIRNRGDLDEASGAYKDIGEVMDNQLDLVERLVELQPLGVIKG